MIDLRRISYALVKEDIVMEAVANDVYTSESDDVIRKRCREREDYLRHERYVKERMAELTSELETVTSEKETLTSENESLTSELERLRAILKEHNISDES